MRRDSLATLGAVLVLVAVCGCLVVVSNNQPPQPLEHRHSDRQRAVSPPLTATATATRNILDRLRVDGDRPGVGSSSGGVGGGVNDDSGKERRGRVPTNDLLHPQPHQPQQRPQQQQQRLQQPQRKLLSSTTPSSTTEMSFPSLSGTSLDESDFPSDSFTFDARAQRERDSRKDRVGYVASPLAAATSIKVMEAIVWELPSAKMIKSGSMDSDYLFKLATSIVIVVVPALLVGCCTVCVCPSFYCCRRSCGICGGADPHPDGYSSGAILCGWVGIVVVGGCIFGLGLTGSVANPAVDRGVLDLFEDAGFFLDDVWVSVAAARAAVLSILRGFEADISSVNVLQETIGRYENESYSLGRNLSRDNQHYIDDLTASLYGVQSSINELHGAMVGVQVGLNDTVACVNDTKNAVASLHAISLRLTSVEVNYTYGTASYSTGFNSLSDDGSSIPNLADEPDIAQPVIDQLDGLDNYREMADEINAEWATVAESIDSMANDTRNDLDNLLASALVSARAAVADNPIEDVWEQANNMTKTALSYYQEYSRIRSWMYTVPSIVLFVSAALTCGGVSMGAVGGQKCSKVFTFVALCSFALIIAFSFVFVLNFLVGLVLHTGCGIIEDAPAVFLSDDSRILYDECVVNKKGNLFNTEVFNISNIIQPQQIKADIKASVNSRLNFDEAFTFGGNDIFGALTNASSISFNISTSAFDVTFPELNRTALAAAVATARSEVTYTKLYAKPGPCVGPCVAAYNASLASAVADFHSDLDAFQAQLYVFNATLADCTRTIDSLQNLTARVPPKAAILNDRIAAASLVAANLTNVIDRTLNETKEQIRSEFDVAIDFAVDNAAAGLFALGSCAFMGRHYRAVVTDMCLSIGGNVNALWLVCGSVSILSMINVCCATVNSKRSGNFRKGDSVRRFFDEDNDGGGGSSGGGSDDDGQFWLSAWQAVPSQAQWNPASRWIPLTRRGFTPLPGYINVAGGESSSGSNPWDSSSSYESES